MAGIGKTTFAVHAAHRLAGAFPDGQFFLPLHAHTPGRAPVDPADALASPLLPAGVPAAPGPRRLPALQGAAVLSLEALPPAEAATLLVRLAAGPGLQARDAAVGELTR